MLTPWGKDAIEFVISPNLGEPFKRLRAIASGGELSRVMLAIKGVLAESDHVSTLIFDEVDAGIGGEIALSVGERLAALSRHKQVLCITHLATIAVRADNHLRIEKVTQAGTHGHPGGEGHRAARGRRRSRGCWRGTARGSSRCSTRVSCSRRTAPERDEA